MTDRTQAGGLQVATSLYRFMAEEALPAAGIDPAGFWEGVAQLVADLTPVNRDLLRQRDDFQKAIDAWHHANAGQPIDAAKYKAFLEEIGYLVPDPGPFQVGTATEELPPTRNCNSCHQASDGRGLGNRLIVAGLGAGM